MLLGLYMPRAHTDQKMSEICARVRLNTCAVIFWGIAGVDIRRAGAHLRNERNFRNPRLRRVYSSIFRELRPVIGTYMYAVISGANRWVAFCRAGVRSRK